MVYAIWAYPNTIGALADTVVWLLFNDPNGNMVLQQCKRGDEPRWPCANLEYNANVRYGCQSRHKPKRLTTSTGAAGGVMIMAQGMRLKSKALYNDDPLSRPTL